jgi:hypothetical protein
VAPRLDPFVDILLREQGDQLYLLPDEPVTLVREGKPRKVSKQPLTEAHIYALLAEVAPTDAAVKSDRRAETEYDYVATAVCARAHRPDRRLTAAIPRAPPPPGATRLA